MIRKRVAGEARPWSKIREHYEIEAELADRLRQSSRDERRSQNLYTALYDELFRRVPHHQLLTQKKSEHEQAAAVRGQYGLVRRFIGARTRFLEIGPGDCALSFAVAAVAARVFAADVSTLITANAVTPPNFTLLITDGCSLPLPPDSIDIAYSTQLMEHLHPEDAREQLQAIHAVLKPGGRYICVTPNRAGGPWDISQYYDEVARCFHLKEYTVGELAALFREAGFRALNAYAGGRGLFVRFPILPILWLERALFLLPSALRVRLARSLLFRVILGVQLAGIK